LQRDIRNKTLHYACTGFKRNTATLLRSFIDETGWVRLPYCTDSHLNIHLLAEELAEIKDEISDIRTRPMKDNTLAASDIDDDNSTKPPEITAAVHRGLSDIMRRKSNVIITLKPSTARQGYRRLGEVHADANKPRRLLVPLTSEENAKSLLSVVERLRRSADT